MKSESEVAQSCPTLWDPWTAAHQAPPSMGFSRQECWSGVPLPSPEDWLTALKWDFCQKYFMFSENSSKNNVSMTVGAINIFGDETNKWKNFKVSEECFRRLERRSHFSCIRKQFTSVTGPSPSSLAWRPALYTIPVCLSWWRSTWHSLLHWQLLLSSEGSP